MYETIEIIGDKEYFIRADGKKAFRFTDKSKGYRENELHPDVLEQLNRARLRHNYPSKELIDVVISYQKEHPQKAVNYIKYRLLGECNYLDVFGQDYSQERDALQYRLENLEKEVAAAREMLAVILEILEN